jgi:hypothetical protein
LRRSDLDLLLLNSAPTFRDTGHHTTRERL